MVEGYLVGGYFVIGYFVCGYFVRGYLVEGYLFEATWLEVTFSEATFWKLFCWRLRIKEASLLVAVFYNDTLLDFFHPIFKILKKLKRQAPQSSNNSKLQFRLWRIL